MDIKLYRGTVIEDLGFIPAFVHDRNPESATQQLHRAYAHGGGGWHPFKGFTLGADDALIYPGDPPMRPLAEITLRDERILIYDFAWVAVVQPDRSFEVCRMD